ncbi:predicted protein [Thalassiosira pseudonana CCMP1335]|uniref:AB hydrolase-1 domain-containing protein n=1 Tax=Thalassiosira pseudonana TaxID=35128 RepID=B8LDC8_THAPS|nr:predicted protein [Thalassiosira pseudonana CCMP1335]EED86688.1 predicted protein [Thalassiosira pseudonana CCMP1335]
MTTIRTPTSQPKRYKEVPMPPKSPLVQYFTRKRSSILTTSDLPMEKNAIGYLSPMGIFFTSTMLESDFMNSYLSWLNSLDTLELSLRSAPMLEIGERSELWNYMMDAEDDCVSFISGWFFGESLDKLTRYDVMDFMTWSLFEGRNMEHLTMEEMGQLERFVGDLEYKISVEFYGVKQEEVEDDDGGEERKEGEAKDDKEERDFFLPPSPRRQHLMQNYGSKPPTLPIQLESPTKLKQKQQRPKPNKAFHFQTSREGESHHSYFSNLYESYKDWCSQYYEKLENNFRPVQGIKNYVAEKRERLHDAEQSAVATASHMYENAYFTLIEKGGNMDRRLSQFSHATQSQLADAWNSVWLMKERLQTATDISSRRKALRQQLKSYQQTLTQMRAMATAVPSKQMADLMRKITQCYEALESVERSAMDAFLQVTGFVGTRLMPPEPPRYLKYSADPLMDISSYPLMFHILILAVTDGGLRCVMKMRGFQRLRVGPISYYYHPGKAQSDGRSNDEEETDDVPIVFCHGIGIGVIFYMTLVDELLKLGKPLILPEIPYFHGKNLQGVPVETYRNVTLIDELILNFTTFSANTLRVQWLRLYSWIRFAFAYIVHV